MKPSHLDVVQYHQRKKFRWLQLIAKCPKLRKSPFVLRLCICIADRYHTELGYIEFSKNAAAEWLDADPGQVTRARKLLVKLGWLLLVRSATLSRQNYSANRYDLAGGPEDHDLSAEALIRRKAG